MFKTSGNAPGNGFKTKPVTGAPKGGYGQAEIPGKAQLYSTPANKPAGGRKQPANKGKGGYGSYGKPNPKASQVSQPMGSYGNDGMPTPKTGIPKDQKTGRFNLPKGKFV